MAVELIHHLGLCLAAILAAEAAPAPDELASAPIMEGWRVLLSPHGTPVLRGKIIDHPRLGTTMMTTSRLIAISPDGSLARSLSRWFRLGEPYTAGILRQCSPLSPATGALKDIDSKGFTTLDDAAQLNRILSDFAAQAMTCSSVSSRDSNED